MSYPELSITRHDDLYVTVAIDRPKALNALNRNVMDGLFRFFKEGYRDYEPFVAAVVTGTGEKAFAAGADITEFQDLTPRQGKEFSVYGQNVFFAIEQFQRPVIAAVNGYALGGGCELAMACHLRVASENARFGQPEVNLGLIPGYGGTQRLVQCIGKGRAMEYLLTGDMIKAGQALEMGLVNKVVAPEELMTACEDLTKKIAAKAPLAIRNIINTVNAYYEVGMNGFEEESGLFGELIQTRDFAEGTAAFLEKRSPEFTGE